MPQDILIIGGGISGAATAYELARHGISVTLLEQGDFASMASGWTLAGVRQSGRHAGELPLAKSAVARWEVLADELDADIEYRQEGNLRLALAEDETDAIRGVVEDGNAQGLDLEYLDDVQAIREIAPALTEDVVAASFCPTDGHANPVATVRAFADAARRAGATLHTNERVTELLTDDNRVTGARTTTGAYHAGVVIVAAGVYTSRLIAPLGLDLPLVTTHVPAVQTIPVDPMLQQVLGVAEGSIAGRQQVSGQFRLTGGSEPWDYGNHNEHNTMPTMEQVQHLITSFIRLIPALEDVRVAQVWGGLIDRTPDGIPVFDRPQGVEGLVVAAGFSGHGFCLGPVTGEILADLAVEGTTSHPIAPFRLDRFPETETATEALTLHG